MILPDDNSEENKYNINLKNFSSNENFETMNNKILIDSNLTLNIFPYFYYFTEPLSNSFTCLIKSISRNILKDDKEISFGLTNIDNNNYIEILNSKKQKFMFLKGDLIRISYDNNLFLVYLEYNKNNYKKIPFKKDENLIYYPTIIINDKYDILEVLHD